MSWYRSKYLSSLKVEVSDNQLTDDWFNIVIFTFSVKASKLDIVLTSQLHTQRDDRSYAMQFADMIIIHDPEGFT